VLYTTPPTWGWTCRSNSGERPFNLFGNPGPSEPRAQGTSSKVFHEWNKSRLMIFNFMWALFQGFPWVEQGEGSWSFVQCVCLCCTGLVSPEWDLLAVYCECLLFLLLFSWKSLWYMGWLFDWNGGWVDAKVFCFLFESFSISALWLLLGYYWVVERVASLWGESGL